MNRERLKILRDHLAGLPDERVDMSIVREEKECGTVACIAGWAGRWTARFANYSDGWTIYGHDENGEYLVAENINPFADDDEAEAEAERVARLIAAAPAMFEALKKTAALLAHLNRSTDRPSSTVLDALSEARAALSQASTLGGE